jgi:hypothetical protein
MAETVKKGARITGADRAKLAGEPTEKYPHEAFGEVPDESAPVAVGVTDEEPQVEG